MSATSRGLLSRAIIIVVIVIVIIVPLTGSTARTQENLDRNMSGAKLFSATCVGCHRSPRGLAKDRFSWTLSSFLQQHYTSSAASARTLTAYLQAADAARAKPKTTARKSRPAATGAAAPGAAAPALRPPALVPGR